MAINSSIEWTESTWNPLTGCTKTSDGCRHCYAERMSKRLQAMGQPNYVNGFRLTLHPHALMLPLSWKKPQSIFVNSMSDLFHDDVPDTFILEVFDIMRRANWHRFQLLTKRAERLATLSPMLPWMPNVWMGVSVEDQAHISRINLLRSSGAYIKYVSFEPLLGHVRCLNLKNIDWVIVGGESGPGARIMEKSWVVEIRNQCNVMKVPFFFKQWGGVNKKKNGRSLEGRTWDAMPMRSL